LSGTVRNLLVKEAGHDSEKAGYDGLIDLVREVNDMPGTAADLQGRARGVFEGILPALNLGFVPPLWKKYVQPNVPQWTSNYAFFLVFYLLFPWLMGPMEGDDIVEVDVPKDLLPFTNFFSLPTTFKVPQSVKAERCRFLEQSNCASVCVNSCKVPSQNWLKDDFGMDLHIQPNYDDYTCRWKFGKPAPPLFEDEAIMVPCFTACPSKFKGKNDAISVTRQAAIMADEDRRLARAVAELTPDGTALSVDSLNERGRAVKQVGKCWSVDESRPMLREQGRD